MRVFYGLTRDLHLYLGLFISPAVLRFAVIVISLVHAWIPGAAQEPATRTAHDLQIPSGPGHIYQVQTDWNSRKGDARGIQWLGHCASAAYMRWSKRGRFSEQTRLDPDERPAYSMDAVAAG